jgi:ribonucleoside-diphosphate reductase alpha chain
VKDSRIGWASAFRQLISLLYSGSLPKWDLSALRPAGTPLKIFGGRSSGPDPLDDLFNFATKVFKKAAGRKLNSIECHDMCCKIAESVVVGGVRRSALISLSNLSDDRMRDSKIGTWWENNPERGLANNSAVYTEKPDMSAFMKEWLALYESKSGERGIFNRGGAIKKAKENGRRDVEGYDLGTNPCGEILLRPNGFCNLSEVVIRPEDTVETLKKKVRLATIIGTFQSTITNFRYLRNVWKRNAEEERLLGVSLTGIMDHPLTAKPSAELEKVLSELKQIAIDTNKEWANKLGIPVSAAITTIKPSGTVSQLVNAASGIHPRYSSHYIRTVRADKNDPLAQFMREQGVPCEDDVMKPDRTWVFSFPIASPDGAITANDVSAIDQLKIYLAYRRFWCEHNPSITVYVREHEWMEVGAWVYKNFDEVGGVSFLPYSDHTYRQAPYQPITKEKFKELADKMPKIDWANFKENISYTEGTQELSCVGGVCEI